MDQVTTKQKLNLLDLGHDQDLKSKVSLPIPTSVLNSEQEMLDQKEREKVE